MKKLLFILAVSALFIGCSDSLIVRARRIDKDKIYVVRRTGIYLKKIDPKVSVYVWHGSLYNKKTKIITRCEN